MVQPTQPSPFRLEFEDLEELKDAPELLKKALSVEYGRNSDRMAKIHDRVRRQVQRHPLDTDSLEVLIARKTMIIRLMQETDARAVEEGREMRGLRHVLMCTVNSRRAMLRRLREMDFKRFEWLLEKLDLVYKPRPFANYDKVIRPERMTRLTDLWCVELKQHRLKEMQDDLERQQPKYLREKAETLR